MTRENKDLVVLGCVEQVSLHDFGDVEIKAKVDTGAYSGALHVTDIKQVKRGGLATLEFSPLGDDSLRTSTTDFVRRLVRSAHGDTVKRYLIPLRFKLGAVEYETVVGLTDRSNMQFEMLIGRRFLSDKNILVDVQRNQEFDYEREKLG